METSLPSKMHCAKRKKKVAQRTKNTEAVNKDTVNSNENRNGDNSSQSGGNKKDGENEKEEEEEAKKPSVTPLKQHGGKDLFLSPKSLMSKNVVGKKWERWWERF
jgi:hypothetical protein